MSLILLSAFFADNVLGVESCAADETETMKNAHALGLIGRVTASPCTRVKVCASRS